MFLSVLFYLSPREKVEVEAFFPGRPMVMVFQERPLALGYSGLGPCEFAFFEA
jgi:hypothetical protein